MTKKSLYKLLIFNGLLSFVNIICFSNAFLHIDMSGKSVFSAAFGIMVIVMSIVLFFYVNFLILFKSDAAKAPLITVENINTLDDCEAAIEDFSGISTFSDSLSSVAAQIKRFRKKKATIKEILLQKFADTEISYDRFRGTVDGIQGVMCLNIKSILNRISAFDEDEYKQIKHGKLLSKSQNSNIVQAKLDIYNEYITFVDKAVERNEEVLLKLDRLLSEISKFNSLSDGEVEDMDAMKEIEALINDTKWYK